MEIDAFRLRHMLACFETLSEGHCDADAVLSEVGIIRDQLAPKSLVPQSAEPHFLEKASLALNDPAFAARAGLAFLHGTSLTAYIARYSRTLQEAVDNSVRYYVTVDPAYQYGFVPAGNAASLTLECVDPEFGVHTAQTEVLMFAALARARSLTERHFYPIEIRFAHPRQRGAETFARLVGCDVLFGAERTEMIVPLDILKAPIPTWDADLNEYLIAHAESLLQALPKRHDTLTVRVRRMLLEALPGRLPDAHEVAAAMGLSPRSFARHLSQEDQSFRTIVDAVRCELAKLYLADTMSIAEIAFSLDYADQAAFSTAFRRWVGQSPKAYRKSLAPDAR